MKLKTQMRLPTNAFRFGIQFTAMAGLLLSVAGLAPDTFYGPLNRLTAKSAGLAIHLIGQNAHVDGVQVTHDGFTVKIIGECTAVFGAILYFSFLMIFPAPLKKKGVGLVMGLSALYVFNIVRIIALIKIGAVMPERFEIAHIYWGQILTVLFVCAASIFWLKTIESRFITEGISSLLLRGVICTSIPFIIWVHIHKGYVHLIDGVALLIFGFLGHQVKLNMHEQIYANHFNGIVMIGLMMAATHVPMKRRIIFIFTGIGLASLAHLLFRMVQVYQVLSMSESAFQLLIILRLVNWFLLPFSMLLLLIIGGHDKDI